MSLAADFAADAMHGIAGMILKWPLRILRLFMGAAFFGSLVLAAEFFDGGQTRMGWEMVLTAIIAALVHTGIRRVLRWLAQAALVVAMLTPLAAHAQKALYVSPSGSDANNGSQSAPFATIAAASSHATAGTTIYVEPGTYAGGFTTSASGVNYVSATPGAAKIVGSGSGNMVWWNKGNNVTIQGFDVSGPAYRVGLYGSGSSTLFEDNTVHDVLTNPAAFQQAVASSNGGAGIEQDGYAGGTNGSVVNNKVSSVGPAGQTSSLLAGIYQTEAGRVSGNTVNNTAGAGIATWHGAKNIDITGNTISAARSGGVYYGSGDSGSSASTGNYITVADNTITASPSGVTSGGITGPNNIVTGNTFSANAVPVTAAPATLGPANPQWQQMTVDGQTVDVLLPPNYDRSKSYPLVLFLHQNGMGCCQQALEGEFTGDFQAMQAQHPSIVVMPLLNQTNGNGGQTINYGGVGTSGGGEQFALDSVAMAESKFNVNKGQVYVTGASMGGQGTDQLMVDHGPNSAQPVFAAGLSMAGTMINVPAGQAAQLLGSAPLIAVHGSQDGENLPGWDEQMAQADPNFHLTLLQDQGHDVWDGSSGYSNPALWNQLFSYSMKGQIPGSLALSMSQPPPSSLSSPSAQGFSFDATSSFSTPSPFSAPTASPVSAVSGGLNNSWSSQGQAVASFPSAAAAPIDPSSIPTIPSTLSCGESAGTGTGQFHVANGKIIDPHGNVFVAKGINADETDDPQEILNSFPGMNFVRLAVGDRPSPQRLQNMVSGLTSHGVVVEIEDHPWGPGPNPQPNALSGGDLAAEINWYVTIASAFRNNPYVWFGTMNEPQGGNVAGQQLATYNAIRGVGNNSILMLEAGIGANQVGSSGTNTAGMTNVVWDVHNYGWRTGGSTDQAAMNNATASAVSGAGQSADGQIPVVIGEFGPACCNIGTANGDQVINATVWATQKNLAQGFVGWAWTTGDDDTLTNNGRSLTNWGVTLKIAVAADCKVQAGSITGVAVSQSLSSTSLGDTSSQVDPAEPEDVDAALAAAQAPVQGVDPVDKAQADSLLSQVPQATAAALSALGE